MHDMCRLRKYMRHTYQPLCLSLVIPLLILWIRTTSGTLSHTTLQPAYPKKSFFCPSVNRLLPCTCSEKNKGLNVICERASLQAINSSLHQLRVINPKITYLRFHYLDLQRLPDYLLNDLDAVHVTIIYANVTTIADNAFNGLEDNLESLDLSQNRLKSFPSLALKKLHNLVYLNLNNNNISDIHAGALDGLHNLIRLSLFSNQIKALHDTAFRGASRSLTRINFGSNLFETFPVNALRNITKLEGLELQVNHIDTISKDNFYGLERLDYLNLASNRIQELQAETFGHLTALNSLDLDDNWIKVIHKDAFLGVQDTLEWLRLGQNRLNFYPSHALRRLTKLKQLDLHGNNLSSIPEDAFEEIGSHLKLIDLHNNSITSIPSTSFYNLHLLQWLHLNDNKIKKIPRDTYEPVLDTLTTLDLQSNPLTCDCELQWFQKWATEEKGGRKVLKSPDKTECHEPQNFNGRSIINIPSEYMTCPMTKEILASKAQFNGSNRAYIFFVVAAFFVHRYFSKM